MCVFLCCELVSLFKDSCKVSCPFLCVSSPNLITSPKKKKKQSPFLCVSSPKNLITSPKKKKKKQKGKRRRKRRKGHFFD